MMVLQGKRQKEELAVLAAVNEDTARFGLALELDAEDYRMLRAQFLGDDSRRIAAKLLRVLDVLTALPGEEFYGARQYFCGVAEDYAVRIGDAVGRGTMEYVL